ncbi:hypothetical protein DFH07DRAFT_148774 [Mycena maculata]|uniref:Non-specific serine/threonine protein kinase n=1 Tax=Mycena maculata TaxID=230809 RepID=A0AAD7JY79_9AGAR|nr:hypothetical protein DFH07DRAFT_148774 [Mycena maculata]
MSGDELLGPPATGSGASPTGIVVYENSISFLKTACTVTPRNEPATLPTLDNYLLSMSADSIVTAIVKSLELRRILLELSSELGLANDPSLRSVLRTDEEAIATSLAFIFDSKSQEDAVLHLEGDSAQCFLDVVQDALDRGFLMGPHSLKARRIIRKLSEISDSLPSSLFITGVTGREEHPMFGGGFGDIYRAYHNDQTVALKHMRYFVRGAELRRIKLKFCREALVWRDLHHPHILAFIGIDRDSFPNSLCMVSPWMEHGTVLNYLKDHGHANVDKLLSEIAQGLQYLHSRDIVHGDLRGANILINQDWNACLADFGLSSFSNTTTSMHTSNRSGSIYWMAPELITPERFGLKFARTPASDVYAFGCVCIELYTGRPPFSELSDAAAMFRVINGERAGRPAGTPAMSNILWQRVTECWAENPATRPITELVVQSMAWPPKQESELEWYNSKIVFKPGEWIDLDLLDENRSLIYAGKLLRQQENSRNWLTFLSSSPDPTIELHVLLFDHYLVMTKPEEKDGVTKYYVVKRPIPLDLLTLVNFTDPPIQRSAGNLYGGGDNAGVADSRSLFPCTLYHNARAGGSHILYAESAHTRAEWKQKLEEALGLRRVRQESNKAFELETLSTDTFLVESPMKPASYEQDILTGTVTCSMPFNTTDGRGLVAIGCSEGVWIGLRYDSRSLRRVLHLKMVTQCAMLEEFGMFLVLADKSLFAYHIEALVPTFPQDANAPQQPQKLDDKVEFFSVGSLLGRTLVIFMKRKNIDSVFTVVEPSIDRINESVRSPTQVRSRIGFRQPKPAWFRSYREFFLPSKTFDVVFLKARIAILGTTGFEIMDLLDFKRVIIPQREDLRLANLAKRCNACRPLGMFRSTDDEFLLCYNEFGLYVDRNGDPSPSRPIRTIEWEGNAERVAFHAPYILLFDNRFIEVRHVETGRLAQIIPGNNVHCSWDGRGRPSDSNEYRNPEARVHAVMNAPDQPGRPAPRAIARHVFQLVPTIPLASPTTPPPPPTTYFTPSSRMDDQ